MPFYSSTWHCMSHLSLNYISITDWLCNFMHCFQASMPLFSVQKWGHSHIPYGVMVRITWQNIYKVPRRSLYKEKTFIIFFPFLYGTSYWPSELVENKNIPGKTCMSDIWLRNMSHLNFECNYFWSSGNLNIIKLYN